MGKQYLPHQQLGLGVLCPDAAHVVAARLFVVYIGHGIKLGKSG